MRRHAAIIVAAVVLVLVAAGLLFLLLFDFKGVFERRASAALERPVTVTSARLRIFPLRVILEDLNVGEAQPGELMNAKHIDATLGFWRLFSGHFVFRHLAIADAKVVVSRDAKGRSNWTLKKEEKDQTQFVPEVRDLSLHNTVLYYKDDPTWTDLVIGLETSESEGRGERQLMINAKGKYIAAPTTITAVGGPILALRDVSTPYPIDGRMVTGNTTITVKGTVTDPVHPAGLDIKFGVDGKDAADLYRLFGIALPPTPPYKLSAKLDHDSGRWIFRDLTWKLGDTDLGGELTWNKPEEGKPSLTGKLHSKNLNIDDLGGFIGAAPGNAKTPEHEQVAAANLEKEKRAKTGVPAPPPDKKLPKAKSGEKIPAPVPTAQVADKLVIPDMPMNFDKANAMNADVTLVADHVMNAPIPVDDMILHLVLHDGILKLAPLTIGTEPGSIKFILSVNATRSPVRTDAKVAIQNYPIQRLLKQKDEANNPTSFGAIGGHIDLAGDGDSLHRLLDDADGEFALIGQGGRISDLVVQVIGMQVANIIGLLLSEDRPVPIRCMVMDFGVDKGTMTTQNLVVDTQKSLITGTGKIDLGSEVLDLTLHAKPKKAGIFSLKVPFKFGGTFAHPSVGPDKGALIARGGGAAVLGVLLTPIAALLATIEGGGGKDADCKALFADASQ
jgi:uncharacterized protein involved in outer membrane biogenesis